MTRTTFIARCKTAAVAGALVTTLILAGCAGGAETAAEKPADGVAAGSVEYPVTVTDDAGREVTVKAEPQRIVSLAPANTEILFALGLGDRVVGVTSYDDYPEEVADIAKVGDFAGPNIEAVAAADPDLVLATTGVQAEVIAQLEELGATVIAIDPPSLDGLYEDITEIATVTNRASEGAELVEAMRERVAAVQDAVSTEEPVSVFIEIGQNPLFTVGKGTILDELVTLAGGKNVVTEQSYVPYSVEQLIKADPEHYLATAGTMSDPQALEKRPGYKDLQSVKAKRVSILDDNLVTRPGPRIVDGLEQIARALHPNAMEGQSTQ